MSSVPSSAASDGSSPDHLGVGPGEGMGDGPLATEAVAASSPVLEKACAIVFLAVGLAVFAAARSIGVRNETGGVDPRFWPTAVSVGIVLAALWMTYNAFTGRRSERDVAPATREGWAQTISAIVIIAVVLGMWTAGVSFLILAPVMLIALNSVFGFRDVKSLLVFPALLTGFLYLVFALLLEVPL